MIPDTESAQYRLDVPCLRYRRGIISHELHNAAHKDENRKIGNQIDCVLEKNAKSKP